MLHMLYNALFYLFQPLIWARLWIRGCKAPAYRKRWAERYGFCQGKVRPNGVLLHSVSVGETLAAIPLVRALRQRYPTVPITVTTMTPTGSERVLSALGHDVSHVYLPYDLPGAMRRFLRHLQPKLVIVMETELWPNFTRILKAQNIPLIIANARLSERSARRYQKVPTFTNNMMKNITLVAAQNAEDGERFIQLGLNRAQLSVTGSLKFDISVTPELASRAMTLRRQWAPHRPVWIATSTHDGEESILLNAHQQLIALFPTLLLILVPRHPERFNTARILTQKAGFNYTLRSSGEIPSADTQVVVGNTMGELMLLYGVADLAFIGGSLVEKGGHNPLEAAAHGIPVLMGPHTFNFKDICAKLQQEEGIITVNDTTSLVNTISTLLADEACRLTHGRRAIEVLHQNQGALQKLLRLLEPYLPLRHH